MLSKRLDLRRTNILVVDDSLPSLELISQVLMGFRVERTVAVRSAQEARDAVAGRLFDLILVDGEMPDGDGISFTFELRRQEKSPNRATPVVLLCSYTPREKVVRARDAGVNVVVKKPVSPAVLLARITWLARTSREFVVSSAYAGPDRRFQHVALGPDQHERRAEQLALAATPERALSQSDIDNLFG